MQTESRAVNTKGQTQQEWMQAVKKAYPDAKITQAKMIDGTVQALLADGRKITWSADHSMSEARASSAAFRSSNARRSELNAMTPEERKAHEDKRAEQQRKRDDARLERERQKNAAKKSVAEATMTPAQIAAARAAAPYGYNPQTGKPNPAPAGTAPAAAPTKPTAAPAAAQPAPAATPQSAFAQKAAGMEQNLLNKIGARAGAAPGSNIGQVSDAYQQKILDRISQAIGLPAGSQIDQVQASQQAYLDKNDPATAAQYKQQIAKAAANPDPDDALLAKLEVMTKTHMAGKEKSNAAELATQKQAAQTARAGGTPVEIMLAQPGIANNQKMLDAIATTLGLPAGSSIEQIKAAQGNKPAPVAPAPVAPALDKAAIEQKAIDDIAAKQGLPAGLTKEQFFQAYQDKINKQWSAPPVAQPATPVAEGTDERKRNALWAQITSYEKRAKETKNDIKKQHLLKMADELRSKLSPTTEEKLAESLAALEETITDNVAEAEQQKGADYRDPPEADYGDDYQAMVARVKKLAGLGPLRTVYDPQKRVYKNVPTAVQPGDKK